jgi:GntR family transcriptional regulator/GntR family frlABCD operon transcriptional regulator
MIKTPQHKRLYHHLKNDILSGKYQVGELLPSEFDLASTHRIARSTVRQALAVLEKEGHISKKQGKGSIVADGNIKVGVLSIKGSSNMLKNPSNEFIEKPYITHWPKSFIFNLTREQEESGCIFMKRLRCVDGKPVILELTYLPNIGLPEFCTTPFINDSLIETLKNRYLIEIKEVEEDIRAIKPCAEAIQYLKVKKNDPLLSVQFKYHLSRAELNIFSTLYCNTQKFSVGTI